jgi:hypothetical protein
MSRLRTVLLVFAAVLLHVTAGAAQSSLAEKPQASDKSASVVKIGVAVLKNSATRSVPVTIGRDRLVSDINHMKPPKHAKDAAKVQAVALDSSSLEAANAQARDLGCDYVVFTNLTDLRESGDPAHAPRPGDIRIGRDPVANDPTVFNRHEIQRYGVMEFQLFRLGDPNPRVDTSASVHEATTEDGIVSMLMDRVANRVVSEMRGPNTRPPE